MSAVAPRFSFTTVGNIFNGKVAPENFKQHLKNMVEAVCAASQGRINTNLIQDNEVFTSMLDEACIAYQSPECGQELLHTRLFKILSGKNSDHTEKTSQFLAEKTRKQLQYAFQLSKEMRHDECVKGFFKGLMENTASKDSIEKQIVAFKDLPPQYIALFNKEHAKVQGLAFDQIADLTKNQMMMIIEQIRNPELQYEFNQPQTEGVQEGIRKLEELISKGGEYAEIFRSRLVPGLITVLDKYSRENPEGTPELKWSATPK